MDRRTFVQALAALTGASVVNVSALPAGELVADAWTPEGWKFRVETVYEEKYLAYKTIAFGRHHDRPEVIFHYGELHEGPEPHDEFENMAKIAFQRMLR